MPLRVPFSGQENDPIAARLQSMLGGEYSISRQLVEKYPRYFITMSGSGETLPLDIAEGYGGPLGQTYLIGRQTAGQQPYVETGFFKFRVNPKTEEYAETPQVFSPAERLAMTVSGAFGTKRSGETAEKAFSRLLSYGDTMLGIPPAYLDVWNPQGAAQRQRMQGRVQFAFESTTGKAEDIPPWVPGNVGKDIEARIASLSGRIVEGKPYTWTELAKYGLMYGKSGMLEPQAFGGAGGVRSTYAGRPGEQTVLTREMLGPREPEKTFKSSSLFFGTQQANAYVMDYSTGRPMLKAIKPEVITPGGEQYLARANILYPGEKEGRIGELRRTLFAPTGVPGAAVSYENPARPENLTFGFQRRYVSPDIPVEDLRTLLGEGPGSLAIQKGLVGRMVPGGGPGLALGRFRLPKGEEEIIGRPTEVDEPDKFMGVAGSVSNFQVRAAVLNIPSFWDPVTGKAAAKGASTEPLVTQLQAQYPDLTINRSNISTVNLSAYGMAYDVGAKARGLGEKIGAFSTGTTASVQQGGLNLPVTDVHGEVKGAGMMDVMGIMAAQSRSQILNIFQEYAGKTGTPEAARLSRWVGKNFPEGAGGMQLDLERLGQYWQRQTRKSDVPFTGTGMEAAADIFNTVFFKGVTPESPENIRHLREHEIGLVQDPSFSYRASPDMINFMTMQAKEVLRTMPEFKNATEAQLEAAARQRYSTSAEGGTPSQIATSILADVKGNRAEYPLLTQTAAGAVPYARTMNYMVPEYAGKGRANREEMAALSQKWPEMANWLGLLNTVPGDATRMQGAWKQAFGFYAQTKSVAAGQGYRPENAIEMTPALLQRASAVLEGTRGMPSRERLEAFRGVIGDTGEVGGVPYFPKTGISLVAPRAMQELQYAPLGKEIGGGGRTYFKALGASIAAEQAGSRTAALGGIQGLYNLFKENFSTRGEAFGEIMNRQVPSGATLRYAGLPGLNIGETLTPPDTRDLILRQLGYSEKELPYGRQQYEALANAGKLPVIFSRIPGGSELPLREVGYEEYAGRVGQEAATAAINNPENRGGVNVSLQVATLLEGGDLDKDINRLKKMLRKGPNAELQTFATEEYWKQNAMLTNEKVFEIARGRFQDPGIYQRSSATFNAMKDVIQGVNPLGKGNDLQWGGMKEAQAVHRQMAVYSQATMGQTHNIRNPMIPALQLAGYPEETISKISESLIQPKQLGLDKWPLGKSGVPFASLLGSAKFTPEGELMAGVLGAGGRYKSKYVLGAEGAAAGGVSGFLHGAADIATRPIVEKGKEYYPIANEMLAGMFAPASGYEGLLKQLQGVPTAGRKEVLWQQLEKQGYGEMMGLPIMTTLGGIASGKPPDIAAWKRENRPAYNAWVAAGKPPISFGTKFQEEFPELYKQWQATGTIANLVAGEIPGGHEITAAMPTLPPEARAPWETMLAGTGIPLGVAEDTVASLKTKLAATLIPGTDTIAPDKIEEGQRLNLQLEAAIGRQRQATAAVTGAPQKVTEYPTKTPEQTKMDAEAYQRFRREQDTPLARAQQREADLRMMYAGAASGLATPRQKAAIARGGEFDAVGPIASSGSGSNWRGGAGVGGAGGGGGGGGGGRGWGSFRDPREPPYMSSRDYQATVAWLQGARPYLEPMRAGIEGILTQLGAPVGEMYQRVGWALENAPEQFGAAIAPVQKLLKGIGANAPKVQRAFKYATERLGLGAGAEYEMLQAGAVQGGATFNALQQLGMFGSPILGRSEGLGGAGRGRGAGAKELIQLPEDAVDRYNKLMTAHTAILEKAGGVVENMSRVEKKRYDSLGEQMQMERAHQMKAGVVAELAGYEEQYRTGAIEPGLAKKVRSAERELARLTEEEQYPEQKATGFFRKLLGGWGIMYMQRIAGYMGQGIGYGEQEAAELTQISGTAGARQLGIRQLPYNQRQMLQNQMALAGSNYNPVTALQMARAQQPLFNDIYNTGIAALGAFSGMQFLSMSSTGAAAAAFATAALPVAGAVALGSLALTGWSKAQDPGSLAYRQTFGQKAGPAGIMGGITDMLARSWIDMTGPGVMKPGGGFEPSTAGGISLAGIGTALARGLTGGYGIPATLGIPEPSTPGAPSKQEIAYSQNLVWQTKVQSAMDAAGKTRSSASINQLLASLPQAGQLVAYQTLVSQATDNTGITAEAATKAVSYLVNARIAPDLEKVKQVAIDYQLGINTPDLAAMILAGGGVSAGAMISPRAEAPGEPSRLGMVTEELLKKPLTAAQITAVTGGITAAQQLGAAALYLPGQPQGPGGFNVPRVMKTYERMEQLQGNAGAWAMYQAKVQAATAWRRPTPGPEVMGQITREGAFVIPEYTQAQQAASIAADQALAAQADYRTGIGTQFQQQAYQFNRPALGDQIAAQFAPGGIIPKSQEWFYKQLYAGNQMAMATLAARGGLTPAMAAATYKLTTGEKPLTFQQYTAGLDISMQTGLPTGLAYGTTSLANAIQAPAGTTPQQMQAMTQASAEAAARRIYGQNWQQTAGLAAPGIQRAITGQPLPSGQMVYGLQSLQVDQIMNSYNQSMASAGLAMKGINLSLAFTTGVGLNKYAGTINPQTGQPFGALYEGGAWGLQDAQRNLGYQQQEWQFGFQQRGMNLGAQQFRENMALNQRGTQMQRGWTQQDWGYQTQTRELQWGWRQEDYAENIRFMTGRDRRFAERQMGRETIMHDLEGEQIDKQKSRQKELWKLEDQRFALQNKQFQENLKMQQEQLDKSIEYYQQNKALQEEQTKLERAQYIQQMELQKEAAGLQAHYATLAKDNALAQLRWTIDQAKTQGDANKLAEDALLDWMQAMANAVPIIKSMIDQLLRIPGVTTGSDTDQPPCFIAGTPITMADGSNKTIEKIQVRDLVLSMNIKTREPVFTEVCKVFYHTAEENCGYITVNKQLGVTAGHPMSINGEWAHAKTLRLGDMLLDKDGKDVVVTDLSWNGEQVPSYNFETDDETHNYFAGGVLVHNLQAMKAAGGILRGLASGAVEVGEQGTEGIVGGRVIPHSEWESLKRIHSLFQRPVGVTIAGGSSYIPMGGKKAGAPQIINIYLGNEKLSSFVLDAVTKELRS